MKAYLVGKGKSLDNIKVDWFDDSPIYCINQSADVICSLPINNEIHCVQNDSWINYVPPEKAIWHCSNTVSTCGRQADVYYPELLIGKVLEPTCMCALEIIKQTGVTEIVMIGFDSYFDNSRTYAKVIGIESDEIAPFQLYNRGMINYCRKNGITLKWMDSNGVLHDENNEYSKCILGVAQGKKYERSTDKMISSFLKFNPDGWKVEKFYGEKLDEVLPSPCWWYTSFNKCEVGRWSIMLQLLNKYDTVLYCDGDVRWYDSYSIHDDYSIVLTPHCVTKYGCGNMARDIYSMGKCNIGIIEMNADPQVSALKDFMINQVCRNARKFCRKDGKMWLQNLASTIPSVGYHTLENPDFGINVGFWNMDRERTVFEQDGKYYVRCNEEVLPLRSFHFSANGIDLMRRSKNNAIKKLLEEYLNE